MSGVALAFLTMAAWATTASMDQDQAGGQEGRFGVKVFEPGQEMAADEGGMLRNFHGWWRGERVACMTDMYYYLSDKTRKIVRANKYFGEA